MLRVKTGGAVVSETLMPKMFLTSLMTAQIHGLKAHTNHT